MTTKYRVQMVVSAHATITYYDEYTVEEMDAYLREIEVDPTGLTPEEKMELIAGYYRQTPDDLHASEIFSKEDADYDWTGDETNDSIDWVVASYGW